ncbi:Crp/Fnr family transcriptional regulator [Halomonas sp. M20]|uniref:Crp/Fnr family transcriptional regulator n=1 Tax=Halomonas sp. M20 TaxID=2763264 RepID=UPI001D0A957D|nr:Crp/Fnr family transcriptional regulator [Halomonas sp. M20]
MNRVVFDSIFKRFDIYHTLEKEVTALLDHFPEDQLIHRKAGDCLWQEGESANSLLVLRSGWACSIYYHKDGSRQLLEIYLPGDVLGLCQIASGNRRTNAVMLTDGWVCELPHSSLLKLFDDSPNTAALLFAIINQRQAMLAERRITMTHRSAKQRLAHFICECHTRLLEIDENYRDEFLLPLTQQDLADTLGMSAVHVSRTFSQLAAEGLVQRHLFQLIILDATKLREIAAFDERYLKILWGGGNLSLIEQPPSIPISPAASGFSEDQDGRIAEKQ